MKRLVLALMVLAAGACNNGPEEATDETDGAFDYANFARRFPAASVPYQLIDTSLLNNKDTGALRNAAFSAFIPDSTRTRLVGKGTNVRYVPLAKIEVPKGESYFLLKVTNGARKAALLAVFDKDRNYSAAFPFLLPDTDPSTTQTSAIDKAYTVSRSVLRRTEEEALVEGKDVYAFNADARDFTLIMTDLLDEEGQELINPIDTFARKHKFSGDYGRGKKNLVSVRDGRYPNELAVFIHFEKDEGECTGELKGNVLLTSTTTAVYRQGNDPCVLEFRFTPTAVTLREVEGCGAHRDLKCVFDGSFPRKKEPKPRADNRQDAQK